ncbi:MAG: hypothetical protein R2856_29345 [Caldilineaceae bacterium]
MLAGLILTNPYPEILDTSELSRFEIGLAVLQALWTLWVVIGVWTRRRWVWYWMMLLMAYSLTQRAARLLLGRTRLRHHGC